MNVLINMLKYRAGLLLMLAVATVGFILVIELIGSVTSSGPDDLMAPSSSGNGSIGLPGVGRVFSYALAAAAVIAAVVALVVYRNRMSREGASWSRRTLLIVAGVALLLVAAAVSIGFSGVLHFGGDTGPYEVQGSYIAPENVVLLAVFFLTVTCVAIVRPQLLLLLFAAWLLVGLPTGFFQLPGCQPGEFSGGGGGGGGGGLERGYYGIPLAGVILLLLCASLFVVTVISYLKKSLGANGRPAAPMEYRRNRPWLWVLAGLLGLVAFLSLCASPGLSGLGLVHGPDDVEDSADVSGAFASEVEKYRSQIEYELPMENGNSAHINGQSLTVDVGADATAIKIGSSRTLFTVTGAAHTIYLRNATGDVYQNGSWTQLDTVSLPTVPSDDIPGEISAMVSEGMVYQGAEGAGRAIVLQPHRTVPELLYQSAPNRVPAEIDTISIAPGQGVETFQGGALPLSSTPLDIGVAGAWNPFSRTFEIDDPVESYSWRSISVDFTEDQLASAMPASDPTYYELPDGLPERVYTTASEITNGLRSPYQKARAIESFLAAGYSYLELELDEEPPHPPPGQDPIDWFLFDQRTGGSTAFSSAFVVLARSAGVPSRVVSGWRIKPLQGRQAVNGTHARQWAEIALAGIGWVAFDPTPQTGAPLALDAPRVPGATGGFSPGPQGGSPSVGSPGEPEQGQSSQPKPPGLSLHDLLQSPDPEVRANAALALSGLLDESVLAALAEAALSDPNGLVRESAIRAVATADPGTLAEILADHEDLVMRVAAAKGLGVKDDPSALGPLTRALLADLEPEVRSAAADALGSLGDERALLPLAGALLNDPDSEAAVRAAAALALGDLGQPAAISPLAGALESDGDAAVREAAAAGLGELGNDAATEDLIDSLSGDEESGVRAAAASALSAIGDPQALAPLMQARAEDESAAVRSEAAAALDEFTGDQLAETLEESSIPEERLAAAELLGARGDPSAAPGLIGALTDPEIEVREAAQDSIGQLGVVTSLENGSALLNHSAGVSFIPGATTQQASELNHVPVFEVSGELHDGFLRTAIGDRYVNGQWLPEEQQSVPYSATSVISEPGAMGISPESTELNRVSVKPAGGDGWIPEGVVPTSLRLESITANGVYYPDSAIFASDRQLSSYDWVSQVAVYSESQLDRAEVSSSYPYATLPEGVPERVRKLAVRITSGRQTPYQKARAIEQYLKTNYTYRLADPLTGDVPPGRDPVDWFLFKIQEGTCGNFSSAFVVMARALGIPARVVSGWSVLPGSAVAATSYEQTVYSDQAHQRAEVAFEGLGWIPFEPTASQGAPGRAPAYAAGGGTQAQAEKEAIEALVEKLSSSDPVVREEAQEQLEAKGATVTGTENGGAVVTKDGQAFGIGVGMTTRQVYGNPDVTAGPVFIVTGAAHTRYLRSAVGDVYEDGQWRALDPVSIDYDPDESIPQLVNDEINGRSESFSKLPEDRINTTLLGGSGVDASVTYADSIRLEATDELGNIPAGTVPTSRWLTEVGVPGQVRPFSGTFAAAEAAKSYEWVSQVPQFAEAQLMSASAVDDPTYIQLPEGMPARIRDLALEVTRGHTSTYAKARALERYLSTQYTYSYADAPGGGTPPPGQDPVDWFLFDYREGTCGGFSSGFVVMARSIGIPARVVAGWAIRATDKAQEVRSNQAHQWAEVALEGVGWVQLEPTAPLGPQSRVQPAALTELETTPRPSETGRDHVATTIDITVWPERMERRTDLVVGGVVRTTAGDQVSGMVVEIFINETKEHGGTKIGETTVQRGNYSTTIRVPSSLPRGDYQLIAHAIGNGPYGESWSDPDVTVYSESGLQLTGPGEVAVDVPAVFTGRFIDDTGGGAADLPVQVSVDGQALPVQLTGPSGEFSFTHIFSETGLHEVEVEFEGADLLLGNSVRLEVTGVMPTVLAISPISQVNVGRSFPVEGTLLNARGEPLDGAGVTVVVEGGSPRETSTDGSGKFSTSAAIDEFGEFNVVVEFEGEHPVLPSRAFAFGIARDLTALSISGPGVVPQGQTATLHGSITSESLTQIGARRVVLVDGDGNDLGTTITGTDGTFRYQTAPLTTTGARSIAARFEEHDHLTSSAGSFSFIVVAPTALTVNGPDLAGPGETVELTGILQGGAGQPVPRAPIWVGDARSPAVVTGEDGRFQWALLVEADLGDVDAESIISVPFGFDGTDHLAPSIGKHAITVGIPRLVVERPEPAVRGKTATVRGAVFVGNRPLPGAVVIMEPDTQAVSSETGAFVLSHPLTEDAPLGSNALAVVVPALGLEFEVSIPVKTATNLLVVPLEEVRPGEQAQVRATLSDDSGAGIAGARLTTNQGVQGTTSGSGIALIPITVPEDRDLLAVPVTFSYAGDDFHLALSYIVAIPITSSGFNWLLWAGIPALLVAVIASGFSARRWTNLTLPAGIGSWFLSSRFLSRWNREGAGASSQPSPGSGVPSGVGSPVAEDRNPALMDIAFDKPAPDLPDVWGEDEEFTARIMLYGETGQVISHAPVEVVDSEGVRATMRTDDQGGSSFLVSTGPLGEFNISSRFAGNELFAEIDSTRDFRVVDFSEEIVRLYNSFEEWADGQIPDAPGSTPRELESLLVGSGLTFDYRAVDEIISRFEEADYSEHTIGRRQYEAMYRSWFRIVGE